VTHQFSIYFENTVIKQDIEDNWWVIVMSKDRWGLYDSLRNISFFRYALVGLEVDEFRTYSELREDLPSLDIPGLVISSNFENPIGYKYFSPGYIWRPLEDGSHY